ncbi:MAG: Helix-turn-helix domain [Candidatus Parcubacteria bacterium]
MNMKTTSYAQLLRYLRTERNISQSTVAKQLSLSRTSYLGLEHGTRELTLTEALAITNFYGITLDDLIHNNKPDRERYKMMILAVLRFAKTEGVVLKKTKLACLLYLADMRNYYDTKKSMSGLTYQKGNFGPITNTYHQLLDDMERGGEIIITQILRDDYHMYELKESRGSLRRKITLLNQKELGRLEALTKAWSHAATAELQQFILSQRPSSETAIGSTIDYSLILTEEPHLVS